MRAPAPVYVLRSGEVQERQATVTVEEREWRWRWLVWLPFPRGGQRSIDVSFDHEVGEKSGSWKGGCMGCGYTLFYDEGCPAPNGARAEVLTGDATAMISLPPASMNAPS